MSILEIVSLALVLVVVITVAWRWSSRKTSLPFPAWLAWFLENQLVAKVIGTQTTLARMGLKSGQRVLEIGPGSGRLLIPAARLVLPGGQVVGLDIQEGMAARLKKRAELAGLTNLNAQVGDATCPHFPPGSFDVVFLCTVLGEIPDREGALEQCFVMLRPGGKLSVTEIFGDPHYQSRTVVRKLAEKAGFRVDDVYGKWWHFTTNFTRPDGTPERSTAQR